MKLLIKIINALRRFFKSLGKREKKLIRLITFLNWQTRNDISKLDFDENKITRKVDEFKKESLWPKKIAAFIIFFYKKERLEFLSKICKNLENLNTEIDLTFVVNDEAYNKRDEINRLLPQTSSLSYNFFEPKNLLDPRLLTYSHFEVVKEKLKDKNVSHFLYLEDDILINVDNIKYWITARESLKNYKLIPSFLRTEINKNDNEIYLVDSIKKNSYFWQPKVFSKKNNVALINLLDYFTPAYLYDRELMEEHINGPSGSIDFGHPTHDERWNIPKMQEQGVMERASSLLAFYNVPKGFLHRNVVPINKQTKIIKEYCLIPHLSNRFTHTKVSSFGRIKVNDLFI